MNKLPICSLQILEQEKTLSALALVWALTLTSNVGYCALTVFAWHLLVLWTPNDPESS